MRLGSKTRGFSGNYQQSELIALFLLTFRKKCFSWTLRPIYKPVRVAHFFIFSTFDPSRGVFPFLWMSWVGKGQKKSKKLMSRGCKIWFCVYSIRVYSKIWQLLLRPFKHTLKVIQWTSKPPRIARHTRKWYPSLLNDQNWTMESRDTGFWAIIVQNSISRYSRF